MITDVTFLRKLLIASFISMSFIQSVNAWTIQVTSLKDDSEVGDGVTLRDAIGLANISHLSEIVTIDLSELKGTIVLKSDLSAISCYVAIHGSKINDVTISGGGKYRAFSVVFGFADIRNLRIANAYAKGGNGGNGQYCGGGGGAGMGAALFVNKGAIVNCTHVVFINNKVQGGDGGSWGVSPAGHAGSGGGFAGDGGFKYETQADGGSGGILGEDGEGGASGYEDEAPGDGGFGAGGGAADYMGDILESGDGGFGGGGGGAIYGEGRLYGWGDEFGFGRPGMYDGGGGGGAGLGGAIFVREKGRLFLDHCSFIDNSALGSHGQETKCDGKGMGGAIFIMDNAYAAARDLTFSGNTAEDSGWNVAYLDRDTPDVFGILHDVDGSTTAFPPSAASNWSLYR